MTETKLDTTRSTSEFLTADVGYTSYCKEQNAAGGGILLAVKDDFPSKLVDLMDVCQNDFPCELVDLKDVEDEILWVKISLNKWENIYARVFYRQPNTSIEQLKSLNKSLDIILELTKNNPNNTILLGRDYNYKDINWENYTVLPGSDQEAARSKLLEILVENDLSQHQHEPTRLEKILDLFCTNAPGLVRTWAQSQASQTMLFPLLTMRLEPNLIAKHPDVYTSSRRPSGKTSESTSVPLVTHSWSSAPVGPLKITGMTSRVPSWNWWKTCVSSRITRHRQNLPWWNWHWKRLVRWRQCRYNKAKKSSNPTTWAIYRLTQKEMQKDLDQSRWDYVNNILIDGLENNNNKPFWRFVKSGRQDSVGVTPSRTKAPSTWTAKRKLISWTASSRECSRSRTSHHFRTLPALHTPLSAHWK